MSKADEIAKLYGDKTSLWSRLRGTRSDKYKETIDFISKYNYEALTPNVDLGVAFHNNVIGNKRAKTQKQRAKAQKLFDGLLDDLSLLGLVSDTQKTRKTISVDHFRQLGTVSLKYDPPLISSSLSKIRVNDSSIVNKNGEHPDLNPRKPKKKISASKLLCHSDALPERLEKMLKKFDERDQAAVLKKFSFSKVSLSPEVFKELETLAKPYGLNVFTDLKVNVDKIKTPKITNEQFAERIVQAVKDKKPLDLKCVDMRKCDLSKAQYIAKNTLAKEGKDLRGLKLSAMELRGSKMTFAQKRRFDIAFEKLGQPLVDDKTISKSVVHKTVGAVASAITILREAKAEVRKLIEILREKNIEQSTQAPNPQPSVSANSPPLEVEVVSIPRYARFLVAAHTDNEVRGPMTEAVLARRKVLEHAVDAQFAERANFVPSNDRLAASEALLLNAGKASVVTSGKAKEGSWEAKLDAKSALKQQTGNAAQQGLS